MKLLNINEKKSIILLTNIRKLKLIFKIKIKTNSIMIRNEIKLI